MISIIDLKKAYISLLRGLYKESIKYYGVEIKEGYSKPSFFIEVSPVEMGGGINARSNVFNFYTTYFQKEVNEIDRYKKIEEIRGALGNKLGVGDRFVNVTDYSYSFIGKDNNIIQISFTVSYMDSVKNSDNENYQTIQKINITRG